MLTKMSKLLGLRRTAAVLILRCCASALQFLSYCQLPSGNHMHPNEGVCGTLRPGVHHGELRRASCHELCTKTAQKLMGPLSPVLGCAAWVVHHLVAVAGAPIDHHWKGRWAASEHVDDHAVQGNSRYVHLSCNALVCTKPKAPT